MQISRFKKNFMRAKNAWIPRQSKRTVDGKPKGPNATETKYLRDVLMLHHQPSEVTYEPDPIVITKTTKREYTADFLTVLQNGHKIYHEVKGRYHLPTHERARLAWEIAAEAHPEATFVWAELTRKGWEIERWCVGSESIWVHLPEWPTTSYKKVEADWRRHKKRK